MISQYDYKNNELVRRTTITTSGTAFDTSPDPVVEPGTTTYTTNELNQYTTLTVGSNPAISLAYDLDGNLIEDNIHHFTYDAENRLTSVTPITPMAGSTKVEYAYDYMSRRTQKQVSTYDGSSWVLETEKSFVYDGWNLIKEQTTTGGSTSTDYYVWGLDLSGSLQGAGGIGGLLSKTNSLTSKIFLYTFDANGNVGQLVDSSTGTIAAHYEYDPFGNLLVSTGSEADSNMFRFSTKYYDAEVGLYDYGRRYYSPELGRWPTRDPIEEAGGLNLYVFVVNAPTWLFDPLGLQTCDFCGDELTDWLVREMNRNANRPIVHALYSQRNSLNPGVQAWRFATWALLVKPRSVWDHKRPIEEMLNDGKGDCPTENCPLTITLCGMCFNYDVLSNIHYGYVGRMAGFSEIALKLGPAVVQTDGGNLWEKYQGESHDTPAVEVGFDIYDQIQAQWEAYDQAWSDWPEALPMTTFVPPPLPSSTVTRGNLCQAVKTRKNTLNTSYVQDGCKPCEVCGTPKSVKMNWAELLKLTGE